MTHHFLVVHPYTNTPLDTKERSTHNLEMCMRICIRRLSSLTLISLLLVLLLGRPNGNAR